MLLLYLQWTDNVAELYAPHNSCTNIAVSMKSDCASICDAFLKALHFQFSEMWHPIVLAALFFYYYYFFLVCCW